MDLRDNVQHLQDETIRVLDRQKGELVSAEVAAKVNGKKLENLDAMIAGDLVRYDTVTSVAQTVPVESKASKWAELLGIGGKSVVFSNFVNFRGYSFTNNGVTFTGNTDGTVTAVGTLTDSRALGRIGNKPLSPGHTYLVKGAPDKTCFVQRNYTRADGSEAGCATGEINWEFGEVFTVPNAPQVAASFYVVVIGAAGTAINKTFKPMLVDMTLLGSEFAKQMVADVFGYVPPVAPEIVSAEVLELESKGRNLIDFSKIRPSPATTPISIDASTGTVSVGSSGSGGWPMATITFDGLAGKTVIAGLSEIIGGDENLSYQFAYQKADGSNVFTSIFQSGGLVTRPIAIPSDALRVRLNLISYNKADAPASASATFKGCFVVMDGAPTTFAPYKELHHSVPEELYERYPWLAWSAGDAHSEMRWNADLKRWEGVKRVEKYVFDSSWTKNITVSTNTGYTLISNVRPAFVANTTNAICDKAQFHGSTPTNGTFRTSGGQQLVFNIGQLSVEEARAEFSQNPRTVFVEIPEEIIDLTPVMQDFDRFIETEQGGTVAFVQKSGFKLPVENTIKWCIDLES